MAEDSIISYSDLIGKDGTFEDIKKEIAIIEKQLLDLAKKAKTDIKLTNPNDSEAINKLQKEIAELTQANKNLQKAKETTAKAQKKAIELTQEELIEIEKQKIARREQIQIAKQEAILAKSQENSIEALRAKLSLVTIQWKKLTAEEIKNTETGRLLNAQKTQLTSQLKVLEKATGDHRREVGNYTLAGNKAAGMLSRFGLAGNKAVGVFGRIGVALNSTPFAPFALGAAAATAAWQFFSDKILGNSEEIIQKNKELAESIASLTSDLIKAQREGKFLNIDTSNLSEGEKRLAKIRLLQEDLGKLQVQLNKANQEATDVQNKLDTRSFKTSQEEQELKKRLLELDLLRTNTAQDLLNTRQEINKIEDEGIKKAKEAQKLADENRKKEEARIKEFEKLVTNLQSSRLEAIQNIQAQIAKLEIENFENQLDREIAFEELRAAEETRLRIQAFNNLKAQIQQEQDAIIALYGENSEQLKKFKSETEQELLEIEALNAKLSEEQLEASEQRKLDIRRKYFEDTVKEIDKLKTEQTKTLESEQDRLNDIIKEDLKKQQDAINAAYAYEERKQKEANEKRKENTKQVLSDISATANKIGEEIVSLYERQADLSAKSVDQQEKNLERARDRAAQGLEADIVFEEQELAKRQAEQQRREKQAKQAAKILTLFNLVSAYAQSGDENALFRGLADFALLEAISGGLEGFFEGTEDTGTTNKALDNKGGRLAVLHDNERVVPKVQNMLLRGMSNDDLVKNALIGSHISDTLPSLVQKNTFDIQKDEFIKATKATQISDTNALVVQELRQLNYRLAKQPNIGIEIQKVYENVYDIIKSEVKAGIKKTSKKRL